MGIFSLSSSNDFVTVDIGGNSVTAAIVTSPNHQTCPSIVALDSKPLAYGTPVSMDYYKRSLSSGLYHALTSLRRQYSHKPERFVCLLPSLLSHNTILTVRIDDPKAFIVTDKLLNNVIEKNIRDWLRSDLFTGGNYRLLESSVLDTRVNGYQVLDPKGKQGTRLELTIYVSIAETKTIEFLENIFRNHSHGKTVTYVTSALAHYQTLESLLPQQSDYLFLDPTGELCDLLYVQGGVLRGHITFPIGSQTLLRHIVDSTATIKSDAESTLALYVTSSLPTQATSKISTSLQNLRNTWHKQMTAALQEAAGYGPLPQDVFVIDDDPAARLYAKWITEEGFADLRLGGGELQGHLLGKNQLGHLCIAPESLQYQPSLTLGALFARRLGE